MTATRPSALVLLLAACTLAEPTPLPDAQLPPPCPGCLADQTDDDGDGFCEGDAPCADGALPGDCDDDDPAVGLDDGTTCCDPDGDGICGVDDLCPTVADLVQADQDEDGIGDLCDRCFSTPDDGADADSDGIGDACDPCPAHTGAGQADLDLDGLCDLDPADTCFGLEAAGDLDGDGYCDAPHVLLSEPGAGPAFENASFPTISFSTTSQRALVVWRETGTSPPAANLWGRVLDATHRPVSPPIQLSHWSYRTWGNDYRGATEPALAWNSRDDLHALASIVTFDNRRDLVVRTIGPDGEPVGAMHTLSTGDYARTPALAYNPDANEFLVVYRKLHGYVYFSSPGWYADPYRVSKYEIYSRRLGATGELIGGAPQRVTVTGEGHGAHKNASQPKVLWSSNLQKYVEVHVGNPHDEEVDEVLVLVLSELGEALQPAVTVSEHSPTSTSDAANPAIAESAESGVFLVVWRWSNGIFARTLDPLGQPSGPMLQVNSISHVSSSTSGLSAPDVTWDASNSQFVVAWSGVATSLGLGSTEFEVFQRTIRVDGSFVEPEETRRSYVGADGLTEHDTGRIALTYNPLLQTPILLFEANGPEWGGETGSIGIWLDGPADPGPSDDDGDGVADPLDLCLGPDDADQDGRVWCAVGAALFDCNDNDPARGPDGDGDGLCNEDDPCPTDPENDEDNDGRCRDADQCVGDNSTGDPDQDGVCTDRDPCPISVNDDSDGDGSCDDVDLCTGDDNTGDDDNDGLCNDGDLCVGDNRIDTDGDGAPDACDPCPLDDPDDTDFDGICDNDDACVGDNGSGDDDNDGTCNDLDPCFGNHWGRDSDVDGDGVCNNRDLCEGDDAFGDIDGDGVCGDLDLCPGPGLLADIDGDGTCTDLDLCHGWPDYLTIDTDRDGIGDYCDLCPFSAHSLDQADSDGDGIGNACDACPGAIDLRQGDLDFDGLCDLDPNDRCYGPDSFGDVDSDGICDGPAIKLSESSSNIYQPTAAWSETSRRYLVVWSANNGDAADPDNVRAIWGRMVDGQGRPLTPASRLAQAAQDGVPISSVAPVVAWNSDDDRYLVAFTGDPGYGDKVFAVLVDALGRPVGPTRPLETDRQSATGDRITSYNPDVVYSRERGAFLVYYTALVARDKTSVFRREVDRSGLPRGRADQLVVDFAPVGEWYYAADDIHIAASEQHQRQLVVYVHSSNRRGRTVFAHLASDSESLPVQRAPLRLSDPNNLRTNTDQAVEPSVAYSETSDVFLAVWVQRVPGATVAKWEVYASLLGSDGLPLVQSWRLTSTGLPSNTNANASLPEVVWTAADDMFVVVWEADPATGGLGSDERELFARRVSPTGAMGPVERITNFGLPQDASVKSLEPDAVYNPLLQETLVLTRSNDTSWGSQITKYGTWALRHPARPAQDTDNDGIIDPLDLCPGPDDVDHDGFVACLTGPLGDCDDNDPTTAADLDEDGLCDHIDLCLGDELTGDADGDGVCDDRDACPGHDAYDLDLDGLPDACDPCPNDRDDDQDGVCAEQDLCEGDDALGDADNDGLCDDLDPCPNDRPNDSDYDGTCDSLDLCLGDDALGDADNDTFCDALLTAGTALRPGQPFRLRLSNAGRGARAILLMSTVTAPGPTACHPAAATACTRLQSRRVLADGVVDDWGEVDYTLNVPATVPIGSQVVFQALWFDTATGEGESSQVLQLTTQ